jgi:hypothetical protein
MLAFVVLYRNQMACIVQVRDQLLAEAFEPGPIEN